MVPKWTSKYVAHRAYIGDLRFDQQGDSEFAALQCHIDAIRASAHPMVAVSGFYESHGPPPSGDAHGIVLPHRHGRRNGKQRGGAFCSSLC